MSSHNSSESNFFDKVYEITRKIPRGKVTSYGAIAKYLSSPKAARMVGWALNKSSGLSDFVPAHRVVNRTGLLTGKRHFDGSTLMANLLENEGIIIVDNQIQDFEKVLWNPSSNLK